MCIHFSRVRGPFWEFSMWLMSLAQERWCSGHTSMAISAKRLKIFHPPSHPMRCVASTMCTRFQGTLAFQKTPHHPIIPGVAFQRQCHQIQGKTSNSSNVPRCHTWHTTRGRGILPVCTGRWPSLPQHPWASWLMWWKGVKSLVVFASYIGNTSGILSDLSPFDPV